MNLVIFCHSLVSDWNHGNAHFLRGIVTELLARGHGVDVYEPHDAWSRQHLVVEQGEAAVAAFHAAYPGLRSIRYHAERLDLSHVLEEADLVLVHEWNDPGLVRRIGRHRRAHDHYRLLFHDTHHRAVSDPAAMEAYDLSGYDGVLASGRSLRDLYLRRAWCRRAWTWHEAADTRRFRPEPGVDPEGELVWIGNWGEEERSRELRQFLIAPVAELGLNATVHGVRYPEPARRALSAAGITYAGWLPNARVPEVFAAHRVTLHIPRRPYVEALPGIPTIRVFEALACGIPLICSPWEDVEPLFTAGKDYLVARTPEEMVRQLRAVLHDSGHAAALAEHGRRTVLDRHTCAHRVNELMRIAAELEVTRAAAISA